jgi:phosphoglycerate dehydrogenase-like enzyme
MITQQGGAVAPAVAEHAMALLLALVRRIHESSVNTTRHVWDRTTTLRTTALESRVLAIVGLGNVGRQIARRARAFEMPILAVTAHPEPDPLADEVQPLSGLQNILSRADAIIVSIALTKGTYHLIGAKEFAVCKPSAFFVNVARGGVVDPVALREALNEGRLAGAGIDVTEPEPLPPDDPLWNCPNIIISPHHGGGGSPRSRGRLSEHIGQNLERFVAGKPLAHVLER